MNNKTEENIRKNQILNKIKVILLQDFSEEINHIKKMPLTVENVVLFPGFKGVLVLSEPKRLFGVDFEWYIEGKNLFRKDRFSQIYSPIDLSEKGLSAKEISEFKETMKVYSDINASADFLIQLTENIIKENQSLSDNKAAGFTIDERQVLQRASVSLHTKNIPDVFWNEVKKCISSKIELFPDNYELIAYSLDYYFENTDLISITDEEIKTMVLNLKNFRGQSSELIPDLISAILNCWIELRETGREGNYDAWS